MPNKIYHITPYYNRVILNCLYLEFSEIRPSPDTYDHLSTFKLINSRSISHAIGKRSRTIMWPALKG